MAQKRQYTAKFKFKVVRESFQRDTTIEEVCRKFVLASSVIHLFIHDTRDVNKQLA